MDMICYFPGSELSENHSIHPDGWLGKSFLAAEVWLACLWAERAPVNEETNGSAREALTSLQPVAWLLLG